MENDGNSADLLKITKKEVVRGNTHIHQTDDGTIFYFKISSPQRLYVKWEGADVDADLLGQRRVRCCGADGNAIYLKINKKIYKATFTPPDSINVVFLRNILKNEVIENDIRGIISRVRDGQKFVYRICDDPNQNGVLIDDVDHGFEIKGIHSGKVIYEKYNSNAFNPTVRQSKDGGILLECSRFFDIYTRESYLFIYILTEDAILWAIDMETLEFLQPLRIDTDDLIIHIHGVLDGVIYLDAMDTGIGKSHLATAQLPKEYLEKSSSSNGKQAVRNPVKRRIGDIEANLEITNRKVLESETYIYQLDDGTVFYLKLSEPMRLYVKWKENEIDVGELCEDIADNDSVAAFGNALYFESANKEIHKVVFTPPEFMTVYSRALLESEELHFLGMCSTLRNGKKYVYRMCDDPDEDGIPIEDSNEDCDALGGIHRGMKFYHNRVRTDTPSVRKMSENTIVLDMPEDFRLSLYVHDSSPVVWFIYGNNVYALDTDTAEVLSTFRIADVYEIHSIAGVHNGVMTLRVRFWAMARPFMISVQLPQKYIDSTVAINGTPQRSDCTKWKFIHKQELSKEV